MNETNKKDNDLIWKLFLLSSGGWQPKKKDEKKMVLDIIHIETILCILEDSYIDIRTCKDCPTQCVNYKKG